MSVISCAAEVADIERQEVRFLSPGSAGGGVAGPMQMPPQVELECDELRNAHRVLYRVQATDPNVAQRPEELSYSLESGALFAFVARFRCLFFFVDVFDCESSGQYCIVRSKSTQYV